jgi:hypothetical protein
LLTILGLIFFWVMGIVYSDLYLRGSAITSCYATCKNLLRYRLTGVGGANL